MEFLWFILIGLTRQGREGASPQPPDKGKVVAQVVPGAHRVTTVLVPHHGRAVVAKAGADGTIHLLYDSADGPQYVRSMDNGATFSEAIPLEDRGARKPGLEFYGADMAIGKNGSIHVAMSTNAWKLKLPEEEWGYYYAKLEPGASGFSRVRNLNRKPSEGFSLAANGRGNVAACWLCDKLYANVSHDDGNTFGATVEINPAYDPCNCCTTSAEYGPDGTLAVLYREETDNERDMFLVLWDQDHGQSSRTRISSTLWNIDSCPMTYFAISRRDSGYVAAWPTRGDVFFARLDSKGGRLPPGEIKTPGKTGTRTGLLAFSAADGSTLVAWKKKQRLGWSIYDAQGHEVGSPSFAQSSGSGVAGAVAKDGHFVLFR
jgi:hypothetical protein